MPPGEANPDSQERFRFEPLSESHDISTFECGNQLLDWSLRRDAIIEARANLSRTFLLIDTEKEGAEAIAGYFTLCTDSIYIIPEGAEQAVLFPLVKICYLARALHYKGEGIGPLLLIEAFRKVDTISETAGVAGIHLETTMEGRRLYLEYGFEEHPYEAGMLLIAINDVRAILDAADAPPPTNPDEPDQAGAVLPFFD